VNETAKLVFFIDRSLGKKQVAKALQNAGATAIIHDDRFSQDTPDVEWLIQVGERNWVVLTKDEKIGYRTLEQVAVAQAGVRLFVLVSRNITGAEMGEAFVKALSRMEQFVKENAAPFMAKVYKSGEVKAWKNRDTLLGILADITFSSD
jgi:predicted nuclease of predicted toxin-antitoxin system